MRHDPRCLLLARDWISADTNLENDEIEKVAEKLAIKLQRTIDDFITSSQKLDGELLKRKEAAKVAREKLSTEGEWK